VGVFACPPPPPSGPPTAVTCSSPGIRRIFSVCPLLMRTRMIGNRQPFWLRKTGHCLFSATCGSGAPFSGVRPFPRENPFRCSPFFRGSPREMGSNSTIGHLSPPLWGRPFLAAVRQSSPLNSNTGSTRMVNWESKDLYRLPRLSLGRDPLRPRKQCQALGFAVLFLGRGLGGKSLAFSFHFFREVRSGSFFFL